MVSGGNWYQFISIAPTDDICFGTKDPGKNRDKAKQQPDPDPQRRKGSRQRCGKGYGAFAVYSCVAFSRVLLFLLEITLKG